MPNGVESVSIDSLRKLSAKIGEEYGYAHAGDRNSGLIPTAMLWTPELEKTLRKAITYGAKNEADIKLYNKLCDCLLIKLKKMNPDSVLMPLPHDVAVKVVGECRSEILGNKP